MLAWALLPSNPYNYYQILRVVVCFVAAYVAVVAYRSNHEEWTWTLAAIAALYNPFLHVHFSRVVWSAVNVLTIVLMIAGCLSLTRKPAGSNNPAKP